MNENPNMIISSIMVFGFTWLNLWEEIDFDDKKSTRLELKRWKSLNYYFIFSRITGAMLL